MGRYHSINQADAEERAQQLKLMGYIYSKATQVVIDLGVPEMMNPPTSIKVASSFPTQWYKKHVDLQYGHASTAVAFVQRAWQQRDSAEWLKNTLGKEEFLEDWISVTTLLGGFYWIRIWIIQEVGLAKKLKVCCGRGSVDWMLYA